VKDNPAAFAPAYSTNRSLGCLIGSLQQPKHANKKSSCRYRDFLLLTRERGGESLSPASPPANPLSSIMPSKIRSGTLAGASMSRPPFPLITKVHPMLKVHFRGSYTSEPTWLRCRGERISIRSTITQGIANDWWRGCIRYYSQRFVSIC
jgi:hypothetical protein